MTNMDVFVDKINTLNPEGLRENNPGCIVMHSSYKYPEFKDLHHKHVKQNKWAGVGYHLYISQSGKVYQARPFNVEGAHAIGYNTSSIGVCLHSDNGQPTDKGVEIAKEIISDLQTVYNGIPVISHTYAQAEFVNRLFSENNIQERLEFDENIVEHEQYLAVRQKLDEITNGLSSDSFLDVKRSLKEFTNCPGELFKLLIN